MRDLRKRSDVEKMITADDRVTEDYIDTFTSEDQLVVSVLVVGVTRVRA